MERDRLLQHVADLDRMEGHNPLSQAQMLERKNALLELYNLDRSTKIDWQQKSCIKWLKDGDANTSFFHHSASSRRRCNRISRIQIAGSWFEGDTSVGQAVHRHFTSFYAIDGSPPW